ncbi:MazG-like family protein [Anaerococcus sp. DFU013_CI05]|uniref:MazG-like family protein n=1 Tax=Anaerococcus sp. AH8042_DFU013_CI05 TaxID=3385202 RepID=UPI003A521A43
MTINELIKLTEQWAIDRGLDENGTVEGQLIKTAEEVAELIIGISKDDVDMIKDSIGDVFVTLVIGSLIQGNKNDLMKTIDDFYKYQKNDCFKDKFECIQTLMLNFSDLLVDKDYSKAVHVKINTIILVAELYNLDFADCVESAYKEIADRKGVVKNGTFVKDSEL